MNRTLPDSVVLQALTDLKSMLGHMISQCVFEYKDVKLTTTTGALV